MLELTYNVFAAVKCIVEQVKLNYTIYLLRIEYLRKTNLYHARR